MVIEN